MSKLLAPNGKPSKLTPEQYKLVRTPAFKEWFGDWENSPETASKVVHSYTGEPLVLYHATTEKGLNNFHIFSQLKAKLNFTDDKSDAEYFWEEWRNENRENDVRIIPVFLNVKKIFNVWELNEQDIENLKDLMITQKELMKKWYFRDFDGENDSEYDKTDIRYLIDFLIHYGESWNLIEEDFFQNMLKEKKYDGFTAQESSFERINYGVYLPEQIKLADGSNTTFDSNNPDIRFDGGGNVEGGKLFNDEELLKKWKKGESIGFTAIAHLKSKGLIPRADGKKRKSEKYMENGGNILLAPNGKPSNLTPEQYKLVRTPAFKKWFGDWENDTENASKVVDENGEPLVCYHGTYIKNKKTNGFFTELNTSTYFTDQKLTAQKYPIGDYVFYSSMTDLQDDLGEDIVEYINDNFEIDESKGIMYSSDAENVWQNFEFDNIHIYECFLDIKKPKMYFHFSKNEYEFQDLTKDSEIINEFKNNGYDGLIKIYEARWFTEDWSKLNQGIKADYLKEKHFVIFNSNQIKLADGTNTTFDADNPDIRYKNGGDTKNNKMRNKVNFSKNEEKDFILWMQDGNVSKNPDGSYSTQDAQWRNNLKDMDALKQYYFKEFLSGNRYERGGVIEVVVKGSKGAMRKREYAGMTEQEVIDWWTERGYKLSRSKFESNLKPFTFFIEKYAEGGVAKRKSKVKELSSGRRSRKPIEKVINVRARGGFTLDDFNPLLDYYDQVVSYKKVGKLELQQIVGKNYVEDEFEFKTEKDRDYWYDILTDEQEKYFTIKNKKKYVNYILDWHDPYSEKAEDEGITKKSEMKDYFADEIADELRNSTEREQFIKNLDLQNKFESGGSTDDKHLIAKAIEFIIGSAIETDSIEIEPTKISFKRKNTNVYSSLSKKLIEDTIRMHGKSLKGRYADGGEAGFDDEGTSMLIYHEKKGNFLVPKNQIYLWLYEGEGVNEKLASGEYDYVFYPYASMSMAWKKGFIPPLKRIWTKKFQKDNKGSDKLLGVIKAFLLKDGKELYIDMMSVNPTKKKKGVMSYMIKDLRDTFNLTQDQVTFSNLTKEGEKFVGKKTYADGGGVGHNYYIDKSRFPNEGEIVLPKDVDYDMMSFFDRTNKALLITLKNGKKVKASVGKFYNDIIFHGDLPKQIKNSHYNLQLKEFEKIEVIDSDKFAKNKYADGGDVPHEDKMFQLPLEMVVYVPSTQDVDKVISVDKMNKRVDVVKEYLASKFGGYTSSDKLGGYVDSTGNLVNEDVVQVTSFSTQEAYNENKEELINQLAKWGKEWGQEAIGFEFEGDLMYVPQEL
jgi:hypothetical protein